MQQLVREAMHAGAAGFSSSHGADARRSVQQAGAVAPRAVRGGRDADRDRRRRRRGQHFLPARDRRARPRRARSRAPDRAGQALRSADHRAGHHQARRQSRASGPTRCAFLESARQQGAAIFSVLRTQPFMRPFNWQRGTSLYDGIFHWRDLSEMPPARAPGQDARSAVPRAAALRASTIRTPTAARARRCRRRRCTPSSSTSAAPTRARVGKSLAQLAKERARARGRHHVRARGRRRSRQRSSSGTPRARRGSRPTPTRSAIRT